MQQCHLSQSSIVFRMSQQCHLPGHSYIKLSQFIGQFMSPLVTDADESNTILALVEKLFDLNHNRAQ